jgi:hypothetical protein
MTDIKSNLNLFPVNTLKLSDAASQVTLRLSGIKHLKSPGPESNYLDWEFVLDQFLQATKVSYMLVPMDIAAQPDSWSQDNIAVCSVITRTVQSSNYRYIQPHWGNAAGMWNTLKTAHQELSSGG